MDVAAFKLERYFARYEFAVRHLLCSSDSETLSVRDLLALDPQPEDALRGLLDLRLGYTGGQSCLVAGQVTHVGVMK